MANFFSYDPNCKAVWRFENGALTVDSKGDHTLTENNSPTADTGDYKEGAASVDLDAGDYYDIANNDLVSDFPLRNAGTWQGQHSYCGWFKLDTNPSGNDARVIYSKWLVALNKSLIIYVYNDGSDNYIGVNIGYNGGASAEGASIPPATHAIATGVWYHFGITHDDDTKDWRIRLWNDSNSTNYENTGTFANNIYYDAVAVEIGRDNAAFYEGWDGHIDELVVFNDILTADEIDEIRQGTYGPSVSGPRLMMGCHF